MMRIDSLHVRAFPADVSRANKSLLKVLAASAHGASQGVIEVNYEGEALQFSARVFYAIDLVDAAIIGPRDGAIVAACLGSRHKDGYLRQRSIEVLLSHPRAWSVPYLVEALD